MKMYNISSSIILPARTNPFIRLQSYIIVSSKYKKKTIMLISKLKVQEIATSIVNKDGSLDIFTYHNQITTKKD